MKALSLLAALLAAAWIAGFVWFVQGATSQSASLPREIAADGIVVLTGGADRVAAGLHLLRQGRGRLLLISGVGKGAALGDLTRGTGADDKSLADRITLGRTATTTIGNAEETAAWARENQIRSLLVVTAGYHMQRALREIGRAAPALTLFAAPVMPPAMRNAGDPSTIRLLIGEYTKWLISALGLTRLEAG